MNIKEFAQYVLETVKDSAESNKTDITTEIARYYLDCMEDCDEVSAPEICFFTGTRAKLTAYDYNDEANSLDLFLFVHASTIASRVDAQIKTGIKYLMEFYNQCVKKKSPFSGSEHEFEGEVQDAINIIREAKGKVDIIRFFLLTDGVVCSPEILPRRDEEDEVIYEFHIWDIARIYRQDQIKNGNNLIEIDFENDETYRIRNKNSQRNELVVPKIQCLRVEDDNPSIDTYLAIIPGEVLAKIYNQYRTLLLEKNVRAFLRNKSKVNKRIMATIKKTPEMFFSYNNGISTTASDVELKQTGRIQYITRIKDWQIVNGGQTTASIACATDCDLSQVFVQMKVSVVKNKENYAEIVKSISTCANSQTGIKQSDFDSGEEHLVKLEKLSKEEISPISNQKWFFERMRGQYADTLASLGDIDKKSFKAEYPTKNLMTKTDVAKIMMIWDMKPHMACNSREKCFASYMTALKRNKSVIDVTYWHKVVALSILYKSIEACFEKRCGKQGFKSRTTAYTMAAISYLTNQNLDLRYIWKNEKTQSQLEDIIEREIVKINTFLDQDNSRTFTKNAKCWEELKVLIEGHSIPTSLLLAEGDVDLEDYNEEERNIIAQANAISVEWWAAMLDWAKSHNKLSLIEIRQASNNIKKSTNGRCIKTIKAAEKAINLKKKVEQLGFDWKGGQKSPS